LTSSQVHAHLGAARAPGLREAFWKRWCSRAETIAKHLLNALTYFNFHCGGLDLWPQRCTHSKVRSTKI
jgi:hypothetical protein